MALSPELPDELMREILTRLPVQDVLCFRRVSKPWLSLLTDPGFVKDQSIKNQMHNYDYYLVAQKDSSIFVLSRYKETEGLLLDNNYELVGCVRGLVCLRQNKSLLLWNPAIQQYKEFTFPVIEDSYFPDHIGLGFDSVNNDYKVVICYLLGDLKCAYVYSSSSASWTDLFIPDTSVFRFGEYGSWGRRNVAPKAIVKDCPYWIICTKPGANGMYEPVKFDAGSNEFKLLPSYTSGDKEFEFVNMDDCLTILEYEQISTAICVHVYSLKEEGHWGYLKYYRVESDEFHFVRTIRSVQGFDRGREIKFLRRLRPTQGFEHDGEIVWHQEGKFLCNDHDTNMIKAICGRSCTNFSMCCFRYKPSLVFLRGMKPIHSLNQTRMADD